MATLAPAAPALDLHDARTSCILEQVPVAGLRLLELNAGDGSLAFAAAAAGADEVIAHTTDRAEADALWYAAESRGVLGQVEVVPRPWDFALGARDRRERYDLAICLDLLHHLGPDPLSRGPAGTAPPDETGAIGPEAALAQMALALRDLHHVSERLVLQLGFHWQDDPAAPLFRSGQKRELVHWLLESSYLDWRLEGGWTLDEQGERYVPLDAHSGRWQRELGETGNRPLLFLRRQPRVLDRRAGATASSSSGRPAARSSRGTISPVR